MPQTNSDLTLLEQEQALIQREMVSRPDLYVTPKLPNEILLQRVGILVEKLNLPIGFLKFSPLDFLVEEILLDNTVVAITLEDQGLKPNYPGTGTIYATIIKIGMSTLDANIKISAALNIDERNIGYAGIKDYQAITSQRISIRGVSIEQIKSLNIEGVIFKDISEGSGEIRIGDLNGNRFTLNIRTNPNTDLQKVSTQIEQVKSGGVINFYGPQRFGHPRYLSHHFGRLVLSGRIEELIKSIICQESIFEMPITTKLRQEAAQKWGNWDTIDSLFAQLPFTFRFEREVLDVLRTPNTNIYLQATTHIKEQVKLWTKSYASYLANLYLSDINKKDLRISTIPLLLCQKYENQEPYKEQLIKDGTQNFRDDIKKLPFIGLGREAFLKVKTYPIFHKYEVLPEGAVLSFNLPKGSYATTILMSLFDIAPNSEFSGSKAQIDTKKILGQGSLSDIITHFSPLLKRLEQTSSETEEV